MFFIICRLFICEFTLVKMILFHSKKDFLSANSRFANQNHGTYLPRITTETCINRTPQKMLLIQRVFSNAFQIQSEKNLWYFKFYSIVRFYRITTWNGDVSPATGFLIAVLLLGANCLTIFSNSATSYKENYIQCPLLNRIILGPTKNDNNNRMFQLTDVFCTLHFYDWASNIWLL